MSKKCTLSHTHTHTHSSPILDSSLGIIRSLGEVWKQQRKKDAELGKPGSSAQPIWTEAPRTVSLEVDRDKNWVELERQSLHLVSRERHTSPRALELADETESQSVWARASGSCMMDGAGVATTHQCHVNSYRWLNVDEVPHHPGRPHPLQLRGLNPAAESN